MSDYAHLAPGTSQVIEDTPRFTRTVFRSAAGWRIELTWKPGQRPVDDANLEAIQTKARQALTANATYLGLASPTNAQNVAQIARLTRECNGIIRLLLGALDTDDS